MIRKIFLVFLLAGFSLGLFSLLSIRLPKNIFDELELSAGAAVVLYGGRLEAREKLPSEMERRIQYASSLLRKGRVEDIIISGGLCSEIEGNKSIQEIARKLEVEKGFYCENISQDTIGNLKESSKIALERGYDRLVIIASRWHAGRARRLYLRECSGMEILFLAYPYSEVFPTPSLFDRAHDFLYNLVAYATYRFLPNKIYSSMVEKRSLAWTAS